VKQGLNVVFYLDELEAAKVGNAEETSDISQSGYLVYGVKF
jgi:hypothetical protein